MKTCTKCGKAKPLNMFYKDKRMKCGLFAVCKMCDSIANATWKKSNKKKVKIYHAKYHEKNSDKVRVKGVAWRKANPEKCRIYFNNRRAKKLEAGGKLSVGLAAKLFKLQNGKCPCCNQKLGKKFHLDHVMPLSLGGSNEDNNIQLLLQRCNNQKRAKHPIDYMREKGFLL